MGSKTKLDILVVDDEPLIADSLADILKIVGHEASSLYSASDAIKRATEKPFDVLITDVVMGATSGDATSGIDAAIAIRKILPTCKVLLVSGNERTFEMLKDARERGHEFEILAKPVHPSEIIKRLKTMSI
jgi:DNA-binding NtrC family response regulator